MKTASYILLITLTCLTTSQGQNTYPDTLFTIDNRPFSSDSFMKLYQDNRLQGENQSILSIREALSLYINYILKVEEARKRGLDTIPKFQQDLSTYRNQLLKQYINPCNITEEKIQEAYNRSLYFINARHILIKLKKYSSSKDTLEAYKRALKIRDRLIKGENFTKLARTYSADLAAKSNGGELGYFTVFGMIYPFESAAYNLKINEISMPVLTRFGYHIIQALDIKPNPGKIKVAHLVIGFPPGASLPQKLKAKRKADSLYDQLKRGANFDLLTLKHSSDRKTASRGGELPWFGAFQLVPEFEKAAFALSHDGAFSEPVETPYGYHIIKRIIHIPVETLEESRNRITELIKKDGRCNIPYEKLITQLKDKYNFREYKNRLTNFYSILDYAYADLSIPLFEIADSSYSQEVFSDYLGQQPSKEMNEEFKAYILRIYTNFVNNSILNHHKRELERSDPKIRELLNEYINGLLAFNISNLMIWNTAINETDSLVKFFNSRLDYYKSTFGENIKLETIRGSVISDYQDQLEKQWMEKLHKRYSIQINHYLLDKLENKHNKLKKTK